MRIVLSNSEIANVHTEYPQNDPYLPFYGGRATIAPPPRLEVELVKGRGKLEFDLDWRLFMMERVEYRPIWDAEASEVAFRSKHQIPPATTGERVKKKNALIATSGYEVYSWKWVVICTGADIAFEEIRIQEMAADD